MRFSDERVEEGGVTRRSFELEMAGDKVPGVIWSPEGAKGPRPLILMGHGGSQHKKTAGIVARARSYARKLGYATLALDAPGHGDRISREEASRAERETGAVVRGEAPAPGGATEGIRRLSDLAPKVIAEWKAGLDAAQSLDFVGKNGPVGYWGVSMGTLFGVPFVASEPRINAAIFGLAGMLPGVDSFEAAAKKITIPIQYVFQWDDAVAPRETGIALFNRFGSKEKTMHINPGGHMDIPDFERGDWEAFYSRHLGLAADATPK
jgi:cephalosporin-C deacetylase-like acetyl esterase